MVREKIIEAVKVRINELGVFDDINEMPELDYIDKLLDDSTEHVFRLLPYNKLPLTNLSDSQLTHVGNGVYYLPMGEDYIKFAECKFDVWKRHVNRVATDNEKILQSSDITMGKPSRPVVVENKTDMGAELWFYSVPGDNLNKRLFVVVLMKPEDCPDNLVDAIAWRCTSDYLLSIGKVAESQKATDRLETYV